MEHTNANNTIQFPNINDKLAFLRECIEQVEHQILEREDQHQQLISELEQTACQVQSDIYALNLCNPETASRRKLSLETEGKLLDKEKRQLEITRWRDITALKRELRTLKKEYRTVKVGCIDPMN